MNRFQISAAILVFILFIAGASVSAQPKLKTFFDEADAFLQHNIDDGRVPYHAIEREAGRLNKLIGVMGNISLDKATSQEKKAFYLNAYNILTIHSIIVNGIPGSPMDIDGFFDTITHKIAGRQLTLDDIEKRILFTEFNDPRMHFGLVCAANGCPPLLPYAYLPDKLDRQLNEAATAAVNNNYFIRVNNDKKWVQVSQIFNWYEQDFLNEADSILAYINQYRNQKIPTDYGVDYYEYDWSLNDVEK